MARSPRDKFTRKSATKTPGHSRSAHHRTRPARHWRQFSLVAVEALLLALAGLIGAITVLGQAAERFGGTSMTASLLPFAGTVLILALSGPGLLWLWRRLRRWRRHAGPRQPLLMAGLVLAGAVLFAMQPAFRQDLQHLRELVGGAAEAGKTRVSHQVYAAYRRADLDQLRNIILRAQPFLPMIRAAAYAHDVDEEVLAGLGAAESSYVPRDSRDGGKGLFQITAPPGAALAAVRTRLRISQPDPRVPVHNAQLAAATLRHYLDQMHGDLFLGLLAYNIGPRNGGLQSIMQQYGARDFFTIQPYLQHLPRDYPIRVLTTALAFRLWNREGVLPRYEDGQNARAIQAIGIPGLDG